MSKINLLSEKDVKEMTDRDSDVNSDLNDQGSYFNKFNNANRYSNNFKLSACLMQRYLT